MRWERSRRKQEAQSTKWQLRRLENVSSSSVSMRLERHAVFFFSPSLSHRKKETPMKRWFNVLGIAGYTIVFGLMYGTSSYATENSGFELTVLIDDSTRPEYE